MTSRPARVFIAVLAAWSLAGTAVAYAHSSSFNKQVRAALHDCANTENGSLKGHYSLKVLQTALKDVDAETDQYTGCADVLEAATHKDSLGAPKPKPKPGPVVTPVKGQKGPPSSHGVLHHNQQQIRKRVDKLTAEGGQPLTLPSGQTLTPGVASARSASFLSNLPTPLVIVLAALLAAVVAVSGRALNQVVRTRRSR
jgi:hypothetical protein